MSHRDAKWADAVGKMPPVDLHDTDGLATNLPVCKKRSICRARQTGCACPPACGCKASATLRAGQGAVSCPVFVLGRCGRPPSPRALGLVVSVQGARAGIGPGVAGCLTYWSAGKSRIPSFFPGAREGGGRVFLLFYCSFLQGFGNH